MSAAPLPPSAQLLSPSSVICRCPAVNAYRRVALFPLAAVRASLICRPSSRSCGVAILRRLPVLTAAWGNGGGQTEVEDEKEDELRTNPEGKEDPPQANSGNAEESAKEDKSRRAPGVIPLEIRWRDLLNPDPDNLVAVALTGLLALASVQALWQIFFISLAILLAALKYSFIAALLLFIVITLL